MWWVCQIDPLDRFIKLFFIPTGVTKAVVYTALSIGVTPRTENWGG